VADAPLDELEDDERPCSLYLGSAGVIWALWTLGTSLDVEAVLASALARYRAVPDFGEEAHAPSLLWGETGLLVVAATIVRAPRTARGSVSSSARTGSTRRGS
jgi:hypothetical protein